MSHQRLIWFVSITFTSQKNYKSWKFIYLFALCTGSGSQLHSAINWWNGSPRKRPIARIVIVVFKILICSCNFIKVWYKRIWCILLESAHDKTYNKTCVTSKGTDQPVHPPSIARALVYPSLDSLDADAQAIWIFAGRTSVIVGFVVRWLTYHMNLGTHHENTPI